MNYSTSISVRLTLWYAAISLVALTAFGVVLWFVIAHSMLSWKDRTLESRAVRVEGVLHRASGDVSVDLERLIGILPEGQLIQIGSLSGERLFPRQPAPALAAMPRHTCTAPAIDFVTVQGERYRRLCRPVLLGNQPACMLAHSSLAEDVQVLDSFTYGLCGMASLLLLASGMGGYSLCRQALRPVHDMIGEARSLTGREWSRRLPVPPADDELRRLALEWNGMLARIEIVMKQMEQFTADASHELRSPLAYIRAVAETTLRHDAPNYANREALQAIVDETRNTGDLLDNLLTLARVDAGYKPAGVETAVLSREIAEVTDRKRAAAAAKRQSLSVRATHGTLSVSVSASHLQRIVAILLDNAIKYTGPGGHIRVDCFVREMVEIHVADNGEGISELHLHRVFDRFYRVDQARTDAAEQGAGLGLAIGRHLVELYGGTIQLASKLGEGTTASVAFPLSVLANGTGRL